MKIKDIITCSLESAVSRRIGNLFIILLIAISTVIVYITTILYSNTTVNEKNIKNTIRTDTKKLYSVNIKSGSLQDENVTESVNGFIEEIKKIDGIAYSGGFFSSQIFLNEMKTNSQYQKCNMECSENEILMKHPYSSMVYYCDFELLKMYSMEYTEEYDCIPVLVGGGYRDIISVGDIYSDSNGKYIIVDILPEGATGVSEIQGIHFGENNIVNLDYYFIIPRHYAKWQSACINSIYYGIYQSEDSGRIEQAVKAIALRYNLHIGIQQVKELYKKLEENKSKEDKSTYGVFVILIVVCAVSNVIGNLVSLMIRKRDYGILLASGVSLREIGWIIFVENIIKTVPACTAAFFFATSKYDSLISANNSYAKKEAAMVIMIFGMIMITVSTIGPVLVLAKSQIKDFIEDGL